MFFFLGDARKRLPRVLFSSCIASRPMGRRLLKLSARALYQETSVSVCVVLWNRADLCLW